jgi:hypothetical protein
MWPIAYALTELTPCDKAKIAALVKKAVVRGLSNPTDTELVLFA